MAKQKKDSKFVFFEKKAEYGKGIYNIHNKILWMFYVMFYTIKLRKEYSVIHACDLDAILPSFLIGKLFKKRIIFDVFDRTGSLEKNNLFVNIINKLEDYCYKHSDMVILCEEERKKQTKETNPNILIIPNIPNEVEQFDEEIENTLKKQKETYKYNLSYVGVFDYNRGIEDLLSYVGGKKDIFLNIAGFGSLEDTVKKYADKYSNIRFWGRVDYISGQTIMKNSDIIVAMYYLSNPVHKFAAPNKYYESLALGVPILTTEDTLVGNKVLNYKTGFVIKEGENSIADFFEIPNLKSLILDAQIACKSTWENIYKNYYINTMSQYYLME